MKNRSLTAHTSIVLTALLLLLTGCVDYQPLSLDAGKWADAFESRAWSTHSFVPADAGFGPC